MATVLGDRIGQAARQSSAMAAKLHQKGAVSPKRRASTPPARAPTAIPP